MGFATKSQVLAVVEGDMRNWPAALACKLRGCPQPALLDRVGTKSTVFIVARGENRVAYYDDIEQDFCTGTLIGNEFVNIPCSGTWNGRLRLWVNDTKP